MPSDGHARPSGQNSFHRDFGQPVRIPNKELEQLVANLEELRPEAVVLPDPASAEEAEAVSDTAADRKEKLEKVLKEGWKRGVEIKNAADVDNLTSFCTSVDEPNGDLEMLIESMNAMNADCKPDEKEQKVCSPHIC